jgi:hypothetical protein
VIELLILIVLILALAVSVVFLLGFRLGGSRWQDEMARIRLEGTHARRQMAELTRQAFEAMAEEASKRRQG